MEQGVLLGILGLCAAEDVKKRSITSLYLAIFGAVGIVIHLFGRELSWPGIGLGVAVGVVLLLLSRLTRGSIGMGDGLVFCVTGIFLGGVCNLELLMISLLYAAFFSLGMLTFGKKYKNRWKREIPFLPFVFLGYATLLVRGLL